ncbi:MAG: hypothetical protein Q9M11_04085 [Mariprofundaceae bacterium]|nr:hypothetical protein [Mariprofundaceae bacterium]
MTNLLMNFPYKVDWLTLTMPQWVFGHAARLKLCRPLQMKKILAILEQAFRYDPDDSNPYLMSICIVSESAHPLPHLEYLFRMGIFLLRSKRNNLWKEILLTWGDWLEPNYKTIHV